MSGQLFIGRVHPGLTLNAFHLTISANMVSRKSNPNQSPGQGFSAVFTGLLFDYLRLHQLDFAPVLGQAAPSDADNTLTRIPRTQWSAMLAHVAQQLNDPAFGLHLGQSIRPTHLGVLGYTLLSCPNVGAALQRWQHYERLVHNLTPLQMQAIGRSLVIEWPTSNDIVYAMLDEIALTAQVQFVRNITGLRVNPERVCFRHTAPADTRPHEDFFGCPVWFGQAYMSIQLPLTVVDLPLAQADAALLSMMERQAALLLAQLKDSNNLVSLVRACIARQAREGDLSIENVAESLNQSSRTLHRHLASEGWNFRKLRNDTRRKLAESYLRDPALTLAEIAWLLGYSEQSAFTRAFRQWTGVAPGSWKDHLGD